MINVGTPDRILRFVIGIILLLIPFLPVAASLFVGWGSWKYLVSVVGIVLLATAAFRFCPLYSLIGVRTCSTGK